MSELLLGSSWKRSLLCKLSLLASELVLLNPFLHVRASAFTNCISANQKYLALWKYLWCCQCACILKYPSVQRQAFDDITCSRSICDANGHLNLEGFKSMALRLISANSADANQAAGKQTSIFSSAKAAVATVSTGLQHLLGSSLDRLEETQRQDPVCKEGTNKVCQTRPAKFIYFLSCFSLVDTSLLTTSNLILISESHFYPLRIY